MLPTESDRAGQVRLEDRDDHEIATRWLAAFEEAASCGDAARAASLFLPGGYLRDLVALTWDLRTFHGRESIAKALAAAFAAERPRDFVLHPNVAPRRKRTASGVDVVEAILEFKTCRGSAYAILRLGTDEDGTRRAWLLATALDEITGHEARVGANREVGMPSLDTFSSQNWLDRRRAAQAYEDREPDVVVVGAGHSGLTAAARLGVLDVDTLVVDKLPRVGDVWRDRYHSLTLHNPVWVNHLPFMPFPETFPVYLPKDKLANWFEAYADAMELNVWTDAELTAGRYDEAAGRWQLTLRSRSGTERLVRPRHVVMATGISGAPRRPGLPGADSFRGTLLHTADYRGGGTFRGARAVVFGTGNSGHDVAQDLYMNAGAQITMVQRTPTTVVNIDTVQRVYERHSTRLPADIADVAFAATPYPEMVRAFQAMTAIAKKLDKDLIDGLNAVGFRTDYGEDESGHRMKYLRYGGGYYINVGCSDLIIEKKIPIIQFDRFARIVPDGVLLVDGTVIPADLIVLATGYEGPAEVVRRVFGPTVADRVGPIWGFDEEGEMRAMYKRTGQPGLWFHAGSLGQARIMSKFLALQIKGCLEGIIDG